jgi:ABC-type Fe3+-hydroxamate transport system substrate-binding protein
VTSANKRNEVMKKFYCFVFIFVFGWWLLTLQDNHLQPSKHYNDINPEILAALNGNTTLMKKLMLQWDNLSEQEIKWIKEFKDDEIITEKYLPQTYVSAAFLLALVQEDNIVAVPRGMRAMKLFHLDNIKLNSDRYNSEEIFSLNPRVAFVAKYSNPSMLETFQKQNIDLHFIDNINTVEGIIDSIHDMGSVIGKPNKAKILALFVKSAMVSGDKKSSFRFLFLDYHGQYKALTNKNLSVQLIQGLGGCNVIAEARTWSLPVTQEDIISLDPDYIFVVGEPLRKKMVHTDAFYSISENKIMAVDEEIQFIPSQHIVLAYLELRGLVEQ